VPASAEAGNEVTAQEAAEVALKQDWEAKLQSEMGLETEPK